LTLVYPDTSVLVSAYVEEAFSLTAESWLISILPGDMVSSAWCETEIASALAAKTRARQITATDRPELLAMITAMLNASARFIPITKRHFESAGDFLSRSALSLGSGDALHLAVAAAAGATLVTLDRRMAEAGLGLGLDVQLLG
jgi:predicted nucleic acid-binding protein